VTTSLLKFRDVVKAMYSIKYKVKRQNFKDNLKRILFKNFEKKRIILKGLFKNQYITFSLRYLFFLKLNNLKKNTSSVRIRNRCIITGRGRSIYKLFRISRLQIKELAYYNAIPGLKQSTW